MNLVALRVQLERCVADADPATLPAVVGLCAELQARAMARLATPVPAQTAVRSPGAELVDAAAMAELVGMSVFWLRDQARANRIPVHRAGRRLLFDPGAVVAAIKALELQTARKDGGQDRRSWAHRKKKARQNKNFAPPAGAGNGASVHKNAQADITLAPLTEDQR